MPPAVALAIPAIAATGASAAGGKKGSNAANKAANQQFQMQQQLFGAGTQALAPAQSYWQALLSGDPNKVAQAVGPQADLIRGQGQASSQQLAATSPMGGQANLAQAENQMGTYNQIARLSAGMQPQAAQQLSQIGLGEVGAAQPNVGSGLKYNTHQQELASGAKGGLGTGLGRAAAKYIPGGGAPGSKAGRGWGGKGGSSAGPSSFPATPTGDIFAGTGAMS